LADAFQNAKIKGEAVIVIAGNNPKFKANDDSNSDDSDDDLAN